MLPKLPYDPINDLQMVAQLGNQPNLLGASPAFPIRSVQELIDYAKANPGKMFFGSSSNGTSMHLTGELLKLMTGAQMVHVPYKAAQQVISDMIGGQVHFMFDNIGSIIGHVRGGRIRGYRQAFRGKDRLRKPASGSSRLDAWLGNWPSVVRLDLPIVLPQTSRWLRADEWNGEDEAFAQGANAATTCIGHNTV